jgi:arylesterase/paraoxonase
VYERDVKTNDLKLVETIPIGTGGDNIDVDINGDLWVGCHYKIFQFLGAISDITGQSIAPSHIIKIAPSQTNKSVVKSFYLNDGQEISASSAFATWQGKVGLIGTVFDKKILLCKI